MAEAAEATEQHRFFCHCCKRETDPKLPDLTCPRCESGFVEEVAEDSSLLTQSTTEASEDTNPLLTELLLRQHISLLADPIVVANISPGAGHGVRTGERVGVSEVTPLSQEASTAAADSGGRLEPNSHQPGLERRSSRPDHMPAVECSSMLQLHSNPGDYAWGQGGLDSVITEHDTCPVCRKSLDGVDNSLPPTSEPPEPPSIRPEQSERQTI
ncbi:hypothetical protein NHX12_024224 [Muraenolepis orangiensis]|uniref:RING-type E3 ubiquitin transferase n=1 Tax=Muraenolepis orangiensis TaxID=630683 RepID=A0A9Q0ENS0_9TELE|nr:hypothetical protein NHX12_024224 [Muraenolepis orangiensis]